MAEITFISKFGPQVTEDLDYCLQRLIKGQE